MKVASPVLLSLVLLALAITCQADSAIRFLHAVANEEPLFFSAGDIIRTDVLQYKQQSRALFPVPSGVYNFQAAISFNQSVVIAYDAYLRDQLNYTFVAAGLVPNVLPLLLIDQGDVTPGPVRPTCIFSLLHSSDPPPRLTGFSFRAFYPSGHLDPSGGYWHKRRTHFWWLSLWMGFPIRCSPSRQLRHFGVPVRYNNRVEHIAGHFAERESLHWSGPWLRLEWFFLCWPQLGPIVEIAKGIIPTGFFCSKNKAKETIKILLPENLKLDALIRCTTGMLRCTARSLPVLCCSIGGDILAAVIPF